MGPADKIIWVPHGNPFRDPSLISGWDPCGLPGGQPAGYPPGIRTRGPCGPRGQNLTGPTWVSRAGPELDFGIGPLRATRRATCGLPAGYPHTGPVWAPRTKSHGSHAGIPCGTRIRDITTYCTCLLDHKAPHTPKQQKRTHCNSVTGLHGS